MKTWGTLKDEILRECNIEGEDFVSSTELLVFANDAKDEAEAEIVSLYDKYLETETALNITSGVDTYDLPSDIYANKITGMYLPDYEIKLLKRKQDLLTNLPYLRYRITNSTADGIKLKLHPMPTQNLTATLHYIRQSKPIVDETSVMDIPIADAFIKQYIKDKVQEKELGPMMPKGRSELLEKQKQLLIESLNHMIPDDSSDELEPDLSYYDSFMDVDVWGY
jgi:hypothetical protein